MGCNCGGKKAGIQYEVNYGNGTTEKVATAAAARAALTAAGNPPGASFKPISA